MIVKELLDKVDEILIQKNEPPRERVNIIKYLRLDHPVINKLESDQEISDEIKTEILESLIEDKPIQYITNMAHFFGLRFYVDESVLIPRPETEELVYKVIQYVQCTQFKILDIGTGSGCIPITLKTKCDQSSVTAIDVSESALDIAKKNAGNHDADVNFIQVDFLDSATWDTLGSYDVIISNPPYISISEKSLMSSSTVKHEPAIALFTEEDPLIFYRQIHQFAKTHLNQSGAIFMELNEYNAEGTLGIFNDDYDCQLLDDMQGKSRILKCDKK